MNTLSLQKIIRHWPSLQTLVGTLSDSKIDDVFPAKIEGVSSSFSPVFALSYLEQLKNIADRKVRYDNNIPKKCELDCVFVVPSEKEGSELELDLTSFLTDEKGQCAAEILNFSWWGTVPYRCSSSSSAVFGERSYFLAKLADSRRRMDFSYKDRYLGDKPRYYIINQRSLLTPVPSRDYIDSLSFSVRKGESFDPIKISEKLTSLGYMRVPRVTMRGEYTLRGEVLDIYMSGQNIAYRIVFDFDKIEKIRSFDTETQSTIEEFDSLLIFPMKEVLWTDELIQKLKSNIEKESSLKEFDFTPYYDDLSAFGKVDGEEFLYPILFEKNCVLDYVDENTCVFFCDYDRLKNAQENFEREYLGLYRKIQSDIKNGESRPVLPPSYILLNFDEVQKIHHKSIFLTSLHEELSEESESFFLNVENGRSFFGNINYLKETIQDLHSNGWQIFIFAESDNQALRVKEILQEAPVEILPLPISCGFGIPDEKIMVISENEIFGRRKRAPKSVKHAKSSVIDTFVELNPGDFVVHVNYGIGKFKGIDRIKAMGHERDYIKLEYANEETVFIPIEQVNLVQRYIGNEGDNPRLDTLGSKSWENRKNRVRQSVEDLAQKLIGIYSKRKIAVGFAFPKDNELQLAFEAAFPYTETPDQITVNDEIKADMEKPVPMDRLLCGDVGYGKTELAMRAAFKAVMGGKQVAFLAPTTILAEQHYESCKERFENFPVHIAHMSRFVSKTEQNKILEDLKSGKIDILVGTHRIIQKDVIFKDLGLVIIDEEQRFGVKDKDRLKDLRASVDYLAMSATPIPRTLHMSMLKIRDMSLLTTPPQSRKPIETVVDEYSDEKIVRAIRREIERGGQVFFLHNRVESLDEVRLKLEHLMPELTIDIAHGQMSATELDDIFRRFKMGGFHVLVSTTIIENGIDIPNVNTIIIDKANMYGVSQLYQLRGRVGRSDRKAYAYLFYPEKCALSEIAMKRLQAISDFTELGSGFKIAMKDMEIRGAGNLLGKDQSGDVYSVGFDMYLRLLEEAVQRLSDEKHTEQSEVLLELEYTGFIPDSYIKNLQTKMEIYKKIASISTKDEYDSVYLELEDRFGPIPDEVYSLLSLAEIRFVCKKLNVLSLKEKMGLVQIEFSQSSNVSIEKILRLVKESGGKVRLNPQRPNVLLLQTGNIGLKEKSLFINEKLESLT